MFLALPLAIPCGLTAAAADDLPQTAVVSKTYNHAAFCLPDPLAGGESRV